MKKIFLFTLIFIIGGLIFAESPKRFSLQTAIALALENDYEIQAQRSAVKAAHAQLLQAKGALDLETGFQAQYGLAQDPVDSKDPYYNIAYSWTNPANDAGVYMNNTLSEQTEGTFFIQKLFGFGLNTKLSYSLSSQRKTPNYIYDDSKYPTNKPHYEQENFRNKGMLSLELSLPLFKSFNNSINALQIEAAENYLSQMEYALSDEISRTIITITSLYWKCFIMHKTVLLLEELLKKTEERNTSMNALIKAGVRSKNDLLSMQVSVNENKRNLQNAKVLFNNAKTELITTIGLSANTDYGKLDPALDEEELKQVTSQKEEALTEDIIEKLIGTRTDMQLLKKNVEIAELKLRIAKAESLPDAQLKFGVGITGANYSDGIGDYLSSPFTNVRGADINGAIGISAKLGNRANKGLIEQAQADYESALNIYKNAQNSSRCMIQNALAKLEDYGTILSDADEALSLHKNLYENEQRRFSAGLITVDNLLSQDQRFIDAETSYYQTLINYTNAILEYKYYTAGFVEIK